MLVIGKASKFYTLWDVTSETHKSRHSGEYTITHYEYIKNLSYDVEAAKAKAPGAEVDESLRGHRSYDVKTWKTEDLPTDEFRCGKYCGTKVADCTDIDYLGWALCNNTGVIPVECQEMVENLLVQNGYRRINESVILNPEQVAEYEEDVAEVEAVENMLDNKERVTFFCERGTSYRDDKPTLHIGNGIFLVFDNYKNMNYRGFDYPMPVDAKGKAKRIKGKNIVLTSYNYTVIPNEYGWPSVLEIQVHDFEIEK